jgi:hypothetical protein
MVSVLFLLAWLSAFAIPRTGEASGHPGDGIVWRSDYGKAFQEAEARGLPLLVVFRGPCGQTQAPGTPGSGQFRTACELLEEDVLSHPDVVLAAARFMAVAAGDLSDRELHARYGVATIPTMLIADPWGNEIVRLVGYNRRDRVVRVLRAIPTEFSGLRESAAALQRGPTASALAGAAAFYEAAGLPDIADLYYERALLPPLAPTEAGARQSLVLARGLSLLRGRRPAEAVTVFAGEAAKTPDGPSSDAVLLGLLLAQLQSGKRGDAERTLGELERRFPGSAYTEKGRQHLRGAAP